MSTWVARDVKRKRHKGKEKRGMLEGRKGSCHARPPAFTFLCPPQPAPALHPFPTPSCPFTYRATGRVPALVQRGVVHCGKSSLAHSSSIVCSMAAPDPPDSPAERTFLLHVLLPGSTKRKRKVIDLFSYSNMSQRLVSQVINVLVTTSSQSG